MEDFLSQISDKDSVSTLTYITISWNVLPHQQLSDFIYLFCLFWFFFVFVFLREPLREPH